MDIPLVRSATIAVVFTLLKALVTRVSPDDRGAANADGNDASVDRTRLLFRDGTMVFASSLVGIIVADKFLGGAPKPPTAFTDAPSF